MGRVSMYSDRWIKMAASECRRWLVKQSNSPSQTQIPTGNMEHIRSQLRHVIEARNMLNIDAHNVSEYPYTFGIIAAMIYLYPEIIEDPVIAAFVRINFMILIHIRCVGNSDAG